MITLRTHQHCELCNKPYRPRKREDYDEQFLELWRLANDDSDHWFAICCVPSGLCDRCANEKLISTMRGRIRKAEGQTRNELAEARKDAYARGYDHKPDTRHIGGFYGRTFDRYTCPFDEANLDKNGVCPMCKRKYKLRED